MTTPSAAEPGTRPLGQSLRHYFGAFLPLAEVDGAVREVISRAADEGVAGVVGVFRIAREVLAQRARVTAEVEALILVLDAGLADADAASVTGLAPEAVDAVLREATADAPERVPEPRRTAAGDAPPAPARTPAFLLPAADAPGATPADDEDEDEEDAVAALLREVARTDGPGDGEHGGEADGEEPIAPRVPADATDEIPPLVTLETPALAHLPGEQEEADEAPRPREEGAVAVEEEPSTTPRRLPRRDERWVPSEDGEVLRTIPRGIEGPDGLTDLVGDRMPRRFGAVEALFAVGVLIVLAGVVVFFLQAQQGSRADASPPGANDALAAPEQVAAPAEGAAEAPIVLREVVLTDQVADGVPTPRDVFTRGQGAVVWVRYELRSPGAQLVFVWFREGAAAGAAAEQLDQSVVDLDAAGDVVTADLPPTAMDLPGRYRVDVQLDGQTIATRTFAVATAGV